MRIAVTGAGGGLGRAFLARLSQRHEPFPFSHEDLPVEDLHAVMQRLVPAAPEVIIHAAAMTSVDACELDAEGAWRANALGARNVAIAAKHAGAVLVHVSTDYVFDGEKGDAYHEFDEPNPLSVYGRSKLAGEREVATHAPEHLIVRTAWVFGGGSDFLSGALGRLAAGEDVPAIADVISSPTFVGHLAERLLPLALSPQRGVVHLAGPEPLSWHALLSRAVEELGLPGKVIAQRAEDLDRPAPRPRNSSLRSLLLEDLVVPPMPPVLDGVREALEAVRGSA